jgi:hypothetical protein
MARRPLGHRAQPESELALGLRGRLEFLERPSDQVRLLKAAGTALPGSGKRLLKTAEVDHRLPLFQVYKEHRDLPWPQLLSYWGLPNLQLINREAHVAKCAAEAAIAARSVRTPWRPKPARQLFVYYSTIANVIAIHCLRFH